ncbi:MAG TPA: hypothetical protein EYN66_16170 [Myxococcales bacterium]|nr:hypothetical protein [Myxococcales bacterium]
MSQILDQAHRDIAWQCFDKNISVEAGTGTGKTRVLVDRYLAWTLAEVYGRPGIDSAAKAAGSIVAITFTEKAAGEMQQRILRSLRLIAGLTETRLSDQELNYVLQLHGRIADHWGLSKDTVRTRAGELLAQSHRLEVSTIHAFATQLLRSWPLEAGVHPDFQLEESGFERNRIIRTAVYKQTRAGLAGSLSTTYINLLNRLNPDALVNLIGALVDQDFDGQLIQAQVNGNPASDCRFIAAALLNIRHGVSAGAQTNLINLIHAELEALADALDHHGNNFWSDPKGCLEKQGRESLDFLYKKITASYPKAKQSKLLDTKLPQFQEAVARLRAFMNESRKNDQYTFELVIELFLPLIKKVRKQLKTEGLLSFDNLLQFSADLVQNDPQIAHALTERYGQILVDEFQDTSSLQCNILNGITAADQTGTRLFVVGDAKQGIYSFRNAELAAYSKFTQGMEKLELSTSFRSQRSLVDGLNAGFQRLLVHSPGLQPPPQDLWAYKEPLAITSIQLLDSGKIKADAARDMEADTIIRAILKKDAESPVKAGKRWSRFGVLSRVQTQVSVLMAKLEKAGIPAVVSGDKEFYRRQEVVDAVNLLRVVHNSHDNLAWVGMLRSPIGACPDIILVELAEAGFFTSSNKSQAVDLALSNQSRHPEHLKRLLDLLNCLETLRQSLTQQAVSRWSEQLYSTIPITALYASQYLGERKAANFERVIQGFCQTLMAGVQPINEWLYDAQQRVMGGVEESESALADDTTDAVRIMSIHSSKGLEWEHVFVTRLDWRGKGGLGDDQAKVYRTDMGWILEAGGRHSFGMPALDERRSKIDEAELVRLLYVACTRAESTLTLMGALHTGKMSKLVTKAFLELDGASVAHAQMSDFLPKVIIPTVDSSGHGADLLVSQSSDFWQPRYEAAAHSQPALVTTNDLMSAQKEDDGHKNHNSAGRSAALALGNEIHELLEHWDGHTVDLSHASADAKSIIEGFLASDLVYRVQNAKQVFREMPFLMSSDVGDVAFGSIDLLLEEANGWTVVDYKSNRVSNQQEADEVAQGYQIQGDLYVDAVERALNVSGVGCELWFVRGPFKVTLK